MARRRAVLAQGRRIDDRGARQRSQRGDAAVGETVKSVRGGFALAQLGVRADMPAVMLRGVPVIVRTNMTVIMRVPVFVSVMVTGAAEPSLRVLPARSLEA